MADDFTDPDKQAKSSDDEAIVREAKKLFHRCEDWESQSRKRFLDDLKFANADSDNAWQWPNDIKRKRDYDKRPCLTLNIAAQHNRLIINDAKQNKPAVKIRPVGNGATAQSAKVYEGIVRHIEYISNAQDAYDKATTYQVEGGFGFWRVATDYADDDTFDQEIFIRPVKDPLSVFLDPDIQQVDGSDARYGFIFDDLSREEFRLAYPKYKDMLTNGAARSALGNGDGWAGKDHIRVCEYFRKVEKADKLLSFQHPTSGARHSIRLSEAPDEMLELFDLVIDDPASQTRDITETKVERYLIVGEKIAEKNVGDDAWPGQYIPIVRLIGIETIIDGKLDRKGHTRALKDPQRMYNYNASASVEFGALQTKAPWVGPARAIEGLETYWGSANTVNHSILPYNDIDDDGATIQAPTRPAPPQIAPAFQTGLQNAKQDMAFVSGQYEPQMGEPSNERSGKALMARQRKGETSTYHFQDNLSIAIRFTGKILLDLIPKIYDTQRILKILAEDGAEYEVQIDPTARQAYMEQQAQVGEAVRGIFNPKVGKYDVVADAGPSFGTRRQEGAQAMLELATIQPDVMKVIGDLVIKSMDWPGSQDAAERWKRAIDPALLGKAPPPQMVQLQGQLKQAQTLLATLTQQLAEKELDLKKLGSNRSIEAYGKETDRIKVLGASIDPQQIAQLVSQAVMQALTTTLPTDEPEPQSNGTGIDGQPNGGINGNVPGPAPTLPGFSEGLKSTVERIQ